LAIGSHTKFLRCFRMIIRQSYTRKANNEMPSITAPSLYGASLRNLWRGMLSRQGQSRFVMQTHTRDLSDPAKFKPNIVLYGGHLGRRLGGRNLVSRLRIEIDRRSKLVCAHNSIVTAYGAFSPSYGRPLTCLEAQASLHCQPLQDKQQ
jgi:hypothetical protein